MILSELAPLDQTLVAVLYMDAKFRMFMKKLRQRQGVALKQLEKKRPAGRSSK